MSNEHFQKNFKEQLKKQFNVYFKRLPIGPPSKFQLEHLREHFKEYFMDHFKTHRGKHFEEYFTKLEEHFNLPLKKHCMDIYKEHFKKQSS